MNILKAGPVGRLVSKPEGASECLPDCGTQCPWPAPVMGDNSGETIEGLTETFTGTQVASKPECFRLAIRVRRRILFINLADVVAVQAKGKCVLLERKASCYLLRESISVVAEKLETCGFVRIHRSVLVNTFFVEEIRPLSTGEYCLRVEGGKEYPVSRTYKKNLKCLANLWIGANSFFLN